VEVKRLKAIRYRCILNSQQCGLGIGDKLRSFSASMEKSECLCSGGSMAARVKLKGIDGRAPQGMERAA